MSPLVAFLCLMNALLLAGFIGVVIIWGKANKLLAKYDSIDDVDTFREQCQKEAEKLQAQSKQLTENIDKQKAQIRKYMEVTGVIKSASEAKALLEQFTSKLETIRREIETVEEVADLQEVGFYRRHFEYDTPDAYKKNLELTIAQQKSMIKGKQACVCQTSWTVEGSAAEGRKMVNEQIRLMLRAFNGECDAAIGKVRHNNIDRIEKRIAKCFDAMNKLGATKQIAISSEYQHLKLRELFLTHEHELAKQEEKERQREIKEQLREEQKAEKEIESAKKKAEKEEADKQKALDAARKQLASEHGAHNAKLEALISKLELELTEAIDRKAKAIARAQLTKSGHVYVLSNVGTMGRSVFKIGMTRRLEPLERVKELGDASVPFPFDVHAMIYSEDAPALENALHKRFASRRVNLVNLRREYFNITLQEIQDAVADLHGLVTFRLEPEAEQYRETIAIRKTEQAGVA